MDGIMVEFILWTDNPKTDIDRISEEINIFPVKKQSIGQVKYIGQYKNIKRIVQESSLLYSTEYIDTYEVENVMKMMIDILKPNLSNIINLVKEYELHAKFCVVVSLPEKPIIYIPSDIIKVMSDLSAEIEFDMYLG